MEEYQIYAILVGVHYNHGGRRSQNAVFGKRQIIISANKPKRKWKEQKLYYFSLFGYKDKVERKWRKEKSIFIILYFFLSKFTLFDRKIAG